MQLLLQYRSDGKLGIENEGGNHISSVYVTQTSK
jgi:hypothetical protein